MLAQDHTASAGHARRSSDLISVVRDPVLTAAGLGSTRSAFPSLN